jgi:hypothetical protein
MPRLDQAAARPKKRSERKEEKARFEKLPDRPPRTPGLGNRATGAGLEVKPTEKRHTIPLGSANRGVVLRVTRRHGLHGGLSRQSSPIPAAWENCHKNAVELVDT